MNRSFLGLPTIMLVLALAMPALAELEPERVPFNQVILYDFEHLLLGPVGEGGPSQGEPHELSWAAVGQVDVIEGTIDGRSLLLTHPATGSPTAWFQLPGNVGLTSGQVRFNFQIRPSHRDEFRVLFRRPGSAADSYLTINLNPSGNATAQSGLEAAVALGTYEAGELLEFTVDFDLDQRSWSLWFRGVQLADERPLNENVTQGLGRIGFGTFSSAIEGRTLEFDNIEILIDDPAIALLEADFNDKTPSEPIGTGGAALGEPIAISEWLDTWITDSGSGDRSLFVMKEEADGFESAYTEWRFLQDASVQAGWLQARVALTVHAASNNHFILAADDEELMRIETTANEREVLVRFPDQAKGDVVGGYEIGETQPVRIVCQMAERYCSVALNDEWVIDRRDFAASTSSGLTIDRFFAGMAGVSPAYSMFELNNLRISATAPSALPVSAEFMQQPTDTVCRMAFDPAPTVLVRDGHGEPVPGEWTLVLSEYTSVLGWSPLEIPADPVTIDGLAEFADVVIRRTGQGARLQAVVAGHVPTVMAVSEPFDALPGPLVNADYEGSDDDGPFFAGVPQALWVAVYDDCNNNAPVGTEGTVVIHSGPEGASLSGNVGVVSNEWGEIELLHFVFDRPGEYVLDLEIDGVRMESLSSPIVVGSERIFSDRFQSLSD
ncbi:MAG: hypothetical protein LAT56_04790 [Wenzhouxiangella sp.]|nr:hypothetical protein [Wenzhouxiangella sp.]